MTNTEHDLLGWLDRELGEQRARAAAAVDRAEALREFRSLALTVADRAGRDFLTPEALYRAARGEDERAALVALADRITEPSPPPTLRGNTRP